MHYDICLVCFTNRYITNYYVCTNDRRKPPRDPITDFISSFSNVTTFLATLRKRDGNISQSG